MARRQGASLQQRRSHRRNLPYQKKPLPLPGSAYEQRRADGGRAPHRQKPTRRRRASLHQRMARRQGASLQQRRSRRRNLPRRKKPLPLPGTAYEQRRADGGRAPHRQKPTRRRRASLQQRRSRRRNLPRRKKPLPLPGTAHEPRRVGRCCRADGMTCECGAPPAHDPNDPARQLPTPQRTKNHTPSDKAARCHAASVQGGRYGRPARFSCTHSTAATARHPRSRFPNKKRCKPECGPPAGSRSSPHPDKVSFLWFFLFFF